MKKRTIFFALVFCLIHFFLIAEDLPNGYGGVKLGMSLEQTKEALKKNKEFGYTGERDVSLLPGENRVLIETSPRGESFLERCYFQFYEEKLYIITVNVNRERMDHYSIFSTLCKKYGNPTSLSPEKATWENNSVTFSLERPLALKYVDNSVFNEINAASLVPPSGEEITREMFLEGL